MEKRILLTTLTLLVLLGTALYAGTPFEDDLKTYDPYIADVKGGFNSLFVNPAAVAGQQSVLFSLEAGTFGAKGDYEKIKDFYDLYQTFDDGSIDVGDSETAEEFANLLADNITEDEFDALTAGTALAGYTLEDIMADPSLISDLDSDDQEQLAENFSENPPQSLYDFEIQLAWEAKAGFLINGWGGGVYYRESLPFNAASAGFSQIVGELGIIGGGGFYIGPVALGATLNMSMISSHYDVTLEEYKDLWNQEMIYGYSWGIDAGAILKPVDSLTIGVVFNDIIGSTVLNAGTTTWNEFFNGEAKDNVDFEYKFTMDMDLGVTWQPDWRIIAPKFSFDYYNIIGLGRYLKDNKGELEKRDVTHEVFNHLRLGVNINLIKILNLGFQYYGNYFSVGAGLEIAFFEVYAEFIFDDYFIYGYDEPTNVGANLLLRFNF
jgi:hypothetical protein